MSEINFDIKDKDNPHSLVNVCTQAIGERIAAIPDDVLALDEAELEKRANVQLTDRRLRVAFMMEYERVTRTGMAMNPNNIFATIVTKKYFYTWVVGNSFKLAYIIRPLPEYKVELEEMFQLATDEIRAILKQPLIDEKGKLDHKLASVKVGIWQDLANRTKGSPTQKVQVESKSMNVNVTQELPRNVDEIDRRLAELEGQSALPMIDVKKT